MSRSGYVDGLDPFDLGRWRGWVMSAIRGKRGQAFLREMRDALDAMPEKRLITNELFDSDGEKCALGVVGAARNLDMTNLDPEDPEAVAQAFGVSEKLIREITWENDDVESWTPEKRWSYMRRWVSSHIREQNTEPILDLQS